MPVSLSAHAQTDARAGGRRGPVRRRVRHAFNVPDGIARAGTFHFGVGMARLRMVKPQLRTIAPAVKIADRQAPAGSWQREHADERAFLKTAEWQRLRWAVLLRDGFTCQWPGCGALWAHDPSRLVADHILPVRVAPDRKWDITNLECLCAECHSGPKQAQEAAAYGAGLAGRG